MTSLTPIGQSGVVLQLPKHQMETYFPVMMKESFHQSTLINYAEIIGEDIQHKVICCHKAVKKCEVAVKNKAIKVNKKVNTHSSYHQHHQSIRQLLQHAALSQCEGFQTPAICKEPQLLPLGDSSFSYFKSVADLSEDKRHLVFTCRLETNR